MTRFYTWVTYANIRKPLTSPAKRVRLSVWYRGYGGEVPVSTLTSRHFLVVSDGNRGQLVFTQEKVQSAGRR